MRVPHLVNGLPPCIASTDFRSSASDHIFFNQLSLIAFTPDMDDVPRFAYRMPPSASPNLPFPVLPDVVLFFTRVIQAQSPTATARTSQYRHHHSQRPVLYSVVLRCFLKITALTSQNILMINFVRPMASDSCVYRVNGRFPCPSPTMLLFIKDQQIQHLRTDNFSDQNRSQRLQPFGG
jgi:hypothetical protein